MYIRLPAFTTLLLLIALSSLPSVGFTQKTECLLQNDQLVNPKLAKAQLEAHLLEWTSLAEKCPSEAHILHNLGVINAKLDHWDEAAAYFKKSLESEPRTEQSYQHLNSIYRHQAVTAYRNALRSNKSAPKTPTFSYQLSALQNSDEQSNKPTNIAKEAQSSSIQVLIEDWLQKNHKDKDDEHSAKPEFLLITDTLKPFAVIHTDKHSYVLEFVQTEGQWQLFKERSIP